MSAWHVDKFTMNSHDASSVDVDIDVRGTARRIRLFRTETTP